MTIHGLKMIHRTQVVKLLGCEKQTNSYGHVVYVYKYKSETHSRPGVFNPVLQGQ